MTVSKKELKRDQRRELPLPLQTIQQIEQKAVELRILFLPDTFWRYTGENGSFRKNALRVIRWNEDAHVSIDFEIMRNDLAQEAPHVYRMSLQTLVRNYVANKFSKTIWNPQKPQT